MPSSDVLGIGLSGVTTSERRLATAGHNIANANTEGYSRQRVEAQVRPAQLSGVGALGTGVQISNVGRVHDEFVSSEMRNNASVFNSLETNHEFTSQIDNMLADPEAGLAPTLHQFFKAINSVANDPSSQSARQVLLGEANALSERFSYLNNRFENLRNGANESLGSYVRVVNDIAKSIADVNWKISLAKEVTQGEPNDLLDQRERLLLELSEIVDVRYNEQDDGAVNVFIGNGQTLVLSNKASQLGIKQNEHDPSQLEVVYDGVSGASVITDFLKGGAIGGVLDFRKGILDSAQNELGRIAVGISKTFNDQHHMGMTLNNELGGNFFSTIDQHGPVVLPNGRNNGDIELNASITDIDKLTTDDYELRFYKGEYTLSRQNDGEVVAHFKDFPQRIQSEGFTLSIDRGTTIKDGDSFIIRPTRYAAEQFDVVIEGTNNIAAASPVRVRTSVNNMGNVEPVLSGVTDINTPSFTTAKSTLSPTITVHFIDDTHFELLDDKGNVIPARQLHNQHKAIPATPGEPGVPATPAIPPVKTYPLTEDVQPEILESGIAYDAEHGISLFPTPQGMETGYSVKLTGKARAGDTFVIEFNKDAVGDNTNILALGELQSKATLANGTSNYSEVYSQLVSRVGSKTHELDINREAQHILFEQSKAQREAVSGVNLDEEAANLIRYQQAYQANAQVVGAANDMFQTLMSVLGR